MVACGPTSLRKLLDVITERNATTELGARRLPRIVYSVYTTIRLGTVAHRELISCKATRPEKKHFTNVSRLAFKMNVMSDLCVQGKRPRARQHRRKHIVRDRDRVQRRGAARGGSDSFARNLSGEPPFPR
jgi:hypothetical protein